MSKFFARSLLLCLIGLYFPATADRVMPNALIANPPKRPAGFLPPPLNPRGITLERRKLGEGVYALMSNTDFADNSGFIVGNEAVLVIDSHFNGEMAQQIIDIVRDTTALPIKYLVNTNAFGDHTFGNYIFPQETKIVAFSGTIDALKASTVEGIAKTMARTVDGDLSVFDGVELRIPDQGFEQSWSVDLGGKIVQVHWLGTGMSPNDSVVFLPKERIAWTANLVFGEGSIPWARSGNINQYKKTITALRNNLDPLLIVPGHGEITSNERVEVYESYLSDVIELAKQAKANEVEIIPFSDSAEIDGRYKINPNLMALMTGFHRWNLRVAYSEAVTDR
jgi:cyclase